MERHQRHNRNKYIFLKGKMQDTPTVSHSIISAAFCARGPFV